MRLLKQYILIIGIIMLPVLAVAQTPQFGNGYVNISKKKTGGKVEKNDTLEIRMSIHFPWGYNGGASGKIYRVRYLDSLPTNTQMLTGTGDSIYILTNEGVIYKKYTLAAGDDAAMYNPSPNASSGAYHIRINMGRNPGSPTNTNINPLSGTDSINLTNNYPYGQAPKWWTGHLFSTAYRVRVTGNPGDSIQIQPAKFVFKRTQGGADTMIVATPYKILIGVRDTLCQNGLDINLAGESGGTFNRSSTLNRTTGPSILVPGYTYQSSISASQSLNDGNYAIMNNLSPNGSTVINSRRVPNCTIAPAVPATDSCKNRMHNGYWFIAGDHTGTNTAAGNGPVAPGTQGGYMLMVNADYITTEAYRQTISGLCPDTYYEFSAWVKNICPLCGADSVLNGTLRPGVLPNLTFTFNNRDIYSTGEIDTVGWVKKGFMFKTGPSETSVTVSIRNNAQGGGGNDWALDDIRLSACVPTMSMNYTPYVLGCREQTSVDVRSSCVVRYSYNNSYVYYKWQRSTNNGVTWNDIAGTTGGPATPSLVGGLWQYTLNYNFIASGADSGHRFRVVTATSLSGLSSSTCAFTDGNSTYLRFITCSGIVKAKLLNFTGVINNNHAQLNWQTASEANVGQYEVERSTDGRNFTKIGQVPATNTNNMANYQLTDPEPLLGNAWYRLKMVDKDGLFEYSNIILLGNKSIGFEVLSVQNPFSNSIALRFTAPAASTVQADLFDAFGRRVASYKIATQRGYNNTNIANLPTLTSGIYTLRLQYGNEPVAFKLLRQP